MPILDTSCGVNVNNLMKANGSAGSTAVVLALLLMLALSSVPLSSSFFTVPHDFDKDVSGHTNFLLSQKWGFCKTAVRPVRPPSTSVFHTGVYLENGSIPVASGGNRPVVALLASQTGSAHAYLHNLSLRC